MLKLQSAVEFLTTYGWAFLIVAVVLIVVYLITTYQAPTQYLYSSCTISPQLNCFEPTIESNGTGSTFIVILSNQFGRSILFSANSISAQPSITSKTYMGGCIPSTAPPGATIFCTVHMPGYKQALGSTLSLVFTLSYTICDPKCNSKYNTTGFSTVTMSQQQNIEYFITLQYNSLLGTVTFQGIPYIPNSVVATIKGIAYNISAEPKSGAALSYWTGTPKLTIANSNAMQTTLVDIGNGTLTAQFITVTITTSTSSTSTTLSSSTTPTSTSSSTSTSTTLSTTSTTSSSTSTSTSSTSTSTTLSTTSTTLSTTSTTSSSTSTSTSSTSTSTTLSTTSTTSSSTSTSTSSTSTSTSTSTTSTSTTSSSTLSTITRISTSITVSSFVSGTQVLLANNTYQYIQDIHPGEAVLSYNTKTGKFYTNTVVKVINFTVNGEYLINNLIGTDSGEVFYTSSGTWVHPNDIKIGDKILNPITNNWINVTSVAYIPSAVRVYDIIGSSGNDFVVDGGYLADAVTQ